MTKNQNAKKNHAKKNHAKSMGLQVIKGKGYVSTIMGKKSTTLNIAQIFIVDGMDLKKLKK